MRRIYLIDCPGVVYTSGDTETDIILKGVVGDSELFSWRCYGVDRTEEQSGVREKPAFSNSSGVIIFFLSQFSRRISVDGMPNRRNKAAFSNCWFLRYQ